MASASADEYKIVLVGDSCGLSIGALAGGFINLGTPISRSKTVFRLNIYNINNDDMH